MLSLFLLLSCTDEVLDTADTAPERGVDLLPIPDMTGMDLATAANEALSVALGVTTTQVWEGHAASLELGSAGCPDFYIGDPIEPDEDSSYLGWSDGCVSSQNVEFVGDARWTSDIEGSESGGTTLEGQRELLGDVLVRDGSQTFYSFDGRASDSLLSIVDVETDFSRWTYRSVVDGTLRGSIPLTDSVHPEGYRTDLSLDLSGGDVMRATLTGNVYLFEPLIQGNFDSMVVDMSWAEPAALDPEDCESEPRGWIGVRTPDATWFHLVFQPREEDVASGEDYENDPYTACDGCATLYVRGVPMEELVCVDLSWIWSDARISPPDPSGYLPSLREL